MNQKIDRQLFSVQQPTNEVEPCPQCEGKLQLKYGKHGGFLGCDRYPDCDYRQPLHQNDGHLVKSLGVACPDCGQELVLRQGRYGMFVGCSDYPNCQHIENPTQAAKPVSDLTESLACPECHHGHIVERNTRFGKTFYACDNYPKCRFSLNTRPIKGPCEECGYPLLVEKKLARGIKTQCASRKCQNEQTAPE